MPNKSVMTFISVNKISVWLSVLRIQMKLEELTKTFIVISNWKKLSVHTKIAERRKG